MFIYNGGASANGFPANYTNETTSGANPITGSAVTLTSSNTLTEIEQAAPPGWTLTSARCTDQNNPTGPVIGTLVGNILTIPASDVVAGAELSCLFSNAYTGFVLTGRVIIDNGAGGGGVAYDAAQNGGEQGLAGVPLRLTDCTAPPPFATTVSGGSGQFSLQIPPESEGGPANGSTVCVERDLPVGFTGVSSNAGDLDGPSGINNTGTDPYRLVTSDPGTGSAFTTDRDYSGIVFGLIADFSLEPDQTRSVTPGSVLTIPHVFTATAPADLTFSVAGVQEIPSSTSFTDPRVYLDTDCDGLLAGSESDITGQSGAETVVAEDTVCLLVRMQASAVAPDGAILTYDLEANASLPPLSSGIGTGASVPALANRDTVVVTTEVGSLVLVKQVRRLPDSIFAPASSPASPGDILEYQLTFTNPSATPVSDITISDQIPAFTSLCTDTSRGCNGVGYFVETSPNSMTCNPVGSAGNGFVGTLSWTCTGDMAPGDEGEVRFFVRINP